MNNLLNDPNFLPWLIPVGPLLAFLIITLITNRSKLVRADDEHEYGGHHPDYDGMLVPVVTSASRVATIIVGMSGAISAWLISWKVALDAFNVGAGEFGREVFTSRINWLSTGTTTFTLGVLVDPLTVIMLVMVPLAVTMIFIYSIGYMAHDPRQSRFFALISLFAGAMLTLVVADNLLLLFAGWEIMGLCSFLLIGFWFEKHSAYRAAVKAFMTTRTADVFMLLGIAYLYASTGTLSFRDILYNEAVLDGLANTPAILFGGFGLSAAGLIGVFLIIGTIGKSAQFPLHVWLPDAMEGPTPVSAMIHAAAMVSAGIYAIIRMFPVFEAGGNVHGGVFTTPLLLMAFVGGFTALFAATIAVAQNDVKKVLAYSTISQLGFMMAALGIGAYVAAAFHLITHAFFKALLFMASGSVIHAMEHGEHHVHHLHAHHGHDEDFPVLASAAAGAGAHGVVTQAQEHAADHLESQGVPVEDASGIDAHGHDIHEDHGHHAHDEHGFDEEGAHFDPQDMMNMGGLRHRIPVTAITFAIGGLSLAGFPLITAGFWSKDEILADAFYGMTEGFGPHAFVFFILAIAAFLTAFYTARQLCLTFLGEPRTEEAKHAGLGGPGNVVSITMQLPLVILAVFAIFAGFVGVPSEFPILGPIFSAHDNPFFHWTEYTLLPTRLPAHPPFNFIPVLTSFAVALGGLYLGWLVYGRKPLAAGQPDPLIKPLGPLYPLLKNKYYFDELYQQVIVVPSQVISRVTGDFIDKGLIDGTLHAIARIATFLGDLLKMLNLWLIDGVGDGIPQAFGRLGSRLRFIQTGQVQQYLLYVAIFAILIGLIFAASIGLAGN
jgi:NADH-quinone oxidoreductase subunit L